MATYTVVKGDCLWSIAARYLGSGTRWTQIADLNGISRSYPIIYPGQVLRLDVGGTSAPAKSTPAVSSKATVQYFGLQAGSDNTIFAAWQWDRSNTNCYQVWWEYDTGNSIWFVATNNTTEFKQSTYSPPSNAKAVRFYVKPISDTHTVNNQEVSYWTADWSTVKTYDFDKDSAPKVPSDVSIKIDKYKLTVSASYSDKIISANGIQFQIVKDNATVCNTGNATLKTEYASYSCNVSSGSEYKVRCRAYRGNKYGEWTSYSSNVSTIPSPPSGITTIKATSSTSIYLEWNKSKTATAYDLEYATKKSYFDGSDQTSTISSIEFNHYEKTGLNSGEEYFFRVRATNNQGESAWTSLKSIIIGKKPGAPTTWSSTTTAIVGEPVNLYWVHNSQDGSSQTYGEIELYIDGKKESRTIKNTTDEDEKDKTSVYSLNTSKYKEGVTIQWRVRTSGITKEYGDWSVQRTINVYAPPTLTFSLTDISGEMVDTLTTFPLYVKGVAGPSTQAPIGYYLTITAGKAYETTDGTGSVKTISKGEEIYSKYFDISSTLLVELSANNIDLENNIEYTATCVVSMNSGLTASASSTFNVAWSDDKYEPSAEIGINKETLMAYIRPYCDEYPYLYYKVDYDGASYIPTEVAINEIEGTSVDNVLTTTGEVVYTGTDASGSQIYFCARQSTVGVPVEGVVLSVYRREFDGSLTEIATGIENGKNTYVTDPHPALDFARYRVVAITKTTGAVSFFDVPGYPVSEKAVVIQWNEEWSEFDADSEEMLVQQPWSGSFLKLPYNIDVSDSHSADVSLVEYIGRKRPVSYYGTQLGESASWKVEIDKEDIDTLYALRRLAIWMGDCYVREPSGSGYWANVTVSFSQTHSNLTIPVTLDIKRVEGGL